MASHKFVQRLLVYTKKVVVEIAFAAVPST